MRIDFVTLFPSQVQSALENSVIARAVAAGKVSLGYVDLREFGDGNYHKVDDEPYGGGPGMVLKVDVACRAVRSIAGHEQAVVVFPDARGERYSQVHAEQFSEAAHLILFCGHYEGIDERIFTVLNAKMVSIGDFVLTGGELAASVIADSVVRLLPGVLGDQVSHEDDSFSHDGLLGHPLYTRPAEFEGHKVPEELTSGHHEKIRKWRREQQLLVTKTRRPDLLVSADLQTDDLDMLK